MSRIAIIVPYFGEIPPFYRAWEVTALANNTIDFFVFTDSKEIQDNSNIHVICVSFNKFVDTLQKQFDFPIVCSSPYKLCDYKPVYGLAFSDMLRKYDWWGYCDIDLLLGDIRKFFNEQCLQSYDRCCLLGHLCLYRNSDKMNRLLFVREDSDVAVNYEKVYQTEESMYFDEMRGLFTKGLITGTRVFCTEAVRDPIEWARKFYYGRVKPDSQYIIEWNDGKVYAVNSKNRKKELLYAHFYRRRFKCRAISRESNKSDKDITRASVFQ